MLINQDQTITVIFLLYNLYFCESQCSENNDLQSESVCNFQNLIFSFPKEIADCSIQFKIFSLLRQCNIRNFKSIFSLRACPTKLYDHNFA